MDGKLRVFCNGADWFIAASAEQAIEEWNQFIGDNWIEDGYGDADDWKSRNGDEELTIWFENKKPEDFPTAGFEIIDQNEEKIRVRAKFNNWIKWNGIGFLCSTEI